MKNIKVEPVTHNGEKRIKLIFEYDKETIEYIKKIPGKRWSISMRCWHVPDSKISYDYLYKPDIVSNKQEFAPNKFQQKIPENYQILFKKYKEYITYKRYSENTMRVYMSMVKLFFKYLNYPLPEHITRDDIISFNTNYILKNNYSYNYQNQMISAIKLFFSKVENKNLNIEDIERPIKPRYLPNILSKQEIGKLLNATDNLKHRAILSLIYSAGLRVGEAINMRLEDIDSQRGLIHIKGGKGKKDRIVNLSPGLLQLLRKYYKTYKPKKYLFNGQTTERYSKESVRKIIQKSKQKAGIRKTIKVHTLRHSFATHMLEKGVDIRYIQELLGHSDTKTTMIYTHVSERKIVTFTNPFDELNG